MRDFVTGKLTVMGRGPRRVASMGTAVGSVRSHPPTPTDLTAFAWVWKTGASVTIKPGAFVIIDIDAWEVGSDADVVLSGNPAYVYLKQTKATRATAVHTATLSSYPVSVGNEYRLALYKFVLNDDATTYRLGRDCRGDKVIGSGL